MHRSRNNTGQPDPAGTIRISTRLLKTCAPALLFCLGIAVFGTLVIYAGNADHYVVSYAGILSFLLPFIPWAVLAIVLAAVPLRSSQWVIYNAIIIALAIAAYVHGNILVWDTGILDGYALDLSKWEHSLADLLIWAVLIGAALYFRKWLAEKGWLVCSVLVLIQAVNALILYVDISTKQAPYQNFPSRLSQFSPDTNVLHIVADAFQASIFEALIESDPELASQLDGFTFFRDAVAPSEITYLSIPASLSGIPFRNDRKISEYHDETLSGTNLYSTLSDSGFDIDIATSVWWYQSKDYFSNYYRIPTPFSTEPEVIKGTAFSLLDISLFRQSPHFLKKQVYRKGTWLFSTLLSDHPELQFDHFSHNSFLREFTRKMTGTATTRTYKLIHVVTPHAPLVSDSSCNFTNEELPYSQETFSDQSRCTLDSVIAILDQLRTLGLYDNTLVVIQGDHGGGVSFPMEDTDGSVTDSFRALDGVWGNPLPLLLFKPVNAKGPMVKSDRQSTLTDIPATVMDLLNLPHAFPGELLFAGENHQGRVRHFYRSAIHRKEAASQDHFAQFGEFEIDGSIYKTGSWSEERISVGELLDPKGEYEWGSSILFGSNGNFSTIQQGGWSEKSSPRATWSNGPQSEMEILFADTVKDVVMTMKLKPFLHPGLVDHQTLILEMEGKEVTTLTLDKNSFQDVRINIPAALIKKSQPTRLTLLLPDAVSPNSLGLSGEKRQLGVVVNQIRFTQTD